MSNATRTEGYRALAEEWATVYNTLRKQGLSADEALTVTVHLIDRIAQ
ncbi:hypothetical protein [Streptomyces sp. NPDC002855]